MKSDSRKVNREIKRQKSLGNSQQQNGENHYAVFDRMLEGVQILGFDWYYLYLNAVAEKHNRRPNKELLGNKYVDMWPGIEETHVFSVIKQCMEDRIPSELENRFVYPDGKVGWFTLSIQPVPEGVLIMSFDITEQVQAKNALRRSEEYYRRLAENFPNGTVNIYDRDLRMTFVAGDDLRKYNMGPEEFIGKTFKELAPAETFSIAESHLRAAFEGKSGSYETPYWDDRYYLVNVAPLESADGSIDEILVVTQNLTERKQMEDNLRKTQEQLTLAIRSANVGLWDWNLQTNEVYYSPEWKSQLGYEDHEISNDLSEWERRVHLDDLERARKTVNVYLEKPYPNFYNEFRMQHKDGSYRWILAQGSLITDEQGKPIRMIGSHIDITEKKQVEEALRESEERFRLFIEHAPASLAMFDREMRYLAVSRRWKTDYNLGDREILGHSHYEIFPEIPERWKNIHRRGLSGEVIKAEHDKFVRLDGSVQWQRWEVRPWHNAGGNIGGIVVFSEDITEREQAENKIAFQANLLNAVGSAVIATNMNGTVIYWNPAAEKMYGWSASEALGRDIMEVSPASQSREQAQEIMEQLSRGNSWSGEFLVQRRDGSTLPVFVSDSPILDSNGKLVGIIGVSNDITELKQMETALAENEQRFRALINHAPDGIVIYGSNGRIEYASPATERIMGYGTEEILTTDPAQITHPDDLPALEQALAELTQTPAKTITKQYRLRHKDGSWRWLESNISNFLDVAGIEGLVFNFRDITERKQAEIELRKSENRFRLATKATNDVIWEWNAKNHELLWSENAQVIFGYSPEEIGPDEKWWDEHIHPDDRERIISKMDALIDGNESRWSDEYRFRRQDGSYAYVSDHGFVERDDSGKAIRMVGAMSEISGRKKAEQEIQRRTEDLLLINTLNDAANRGEDIERIVEVFAFEARKVFDCLAVAVYLLSPDAKYIEMQNNTLPRNLTDKIEKLIGQSFPRVRIEIKEGSLLKQNLENEDGTLLNDPKKIRQWIEEYSETTFLPLGFRPAMRKFIPQIYKILKIGSAISIPLVASGRTIGIIEMSSRGQFTEDDLQRVQSISFHVTAVLLRKQVEKQVELQLQRMRALSNIDRAINSSLDMRISLDVLLSEMLSQLEVDAAAILLLNPSTQTLEFVAGKGFRSPSIRQSRVRLGEGFAGQVGINRQILHVSNLTEAGEDFTRSKLLTIEEFVEYFAVPLISKGVLKGVLEVYHRASLDADQEWKNFLETLGGQAAIAIDNVQLFEGMQKSHQELIMAYDATIAGWSRAMDLRDEETEGHTQRVTELTLKLAEKFGVSQREQVQIRRGALLHDIGKLGIPDNILLKPGKLTEDEWDIMRKHPIYAYEMLMPIAYLRPALDIPYCHHEKWDGSGYPRGLKGEQIPLAARIFAVIDVWDALTSDRPYRSAWTEEKTLEYIKEQSGKHFDPDIVEVFLETISKDTR